MSMQRGGKHASLATRIVTGSATGAGRIDVEEAFTTDPPARLPANMAACCAASSAVVRFLQRLTRCPAALYGHAPYLSGTL